MVQRKQNIPTLIFLSPLLTGKAYETSKSYKLAIVCSSSKDGDSFMGAGGSTLILDELEVIGESVAAE